MQRKRDLFSVPNVPHIFSKTQMSSQRKGQEEYKSPMLQWIATKWCFLVSGFYLRVVSQSIGEWQWTSSFSRQSESSSKISFKVSFEKLPLTYLDQMFFPSFPYTPKLICPFVGGSRISCNPGWLLILCVASVDLDFWSSCLNIPTGWDYKNTALWPPFILLGIEPKA